MTPNTDEFVHEIRALVLGLPEKYEVGSSPYGPSVLNSARPANRPGATAKVLPRAANATLDVKPISLLTSNCVKCPQADSNCRPCLRRAVLYPLSYGGQEF